MPVYPGDPAVRVEPVSTVAADGYAVARLCLSDQTGTHVETAAHFLAAGRTLAEEPLARFIGRTSVVDVPSQLVEPDHLVPHTARIGRCPFVLLRSGHADRARRIDPTVRQRPRLGREALIWLVARGIRLLGIDSFDFDAADDYAGHRYLFEHGVLVVEGLVNLSTLPAECDLYVIPLLLAGTGAAPCRAFALLPD